MPSKKVLSMLSLVMITIVSVDSIRNLPATALFGSYLIFFFILGAILFLIPTALVSAELSSSWEQHGGIYLWVKEAFGKQSGFFAIWFQWIENVIWYPTILSFVAGTIGYLIAPSLANDKYFLIAIILCAFWGATLINWLGMKSSARFSTFCAIAGLIVPMIMIIALGFSWIMQAKPLAISLAPHSLWPDLHHTDMWVALTGIMLSFCGMEIATVHAGDVKNPQRAYPIALLIATVIILVTLVLGSLAIAIVIPTGKISLVSGIMEAFAAFLGYYHLNWLLPLMAALLVIGGLGSVSNWIIAPTRGLLVAAKDGLMPEHFQQVNRFEAPAALLLYQATIVTILTAVFLLMPSVNGSYWLLTALAAQLYMFMYILMFAAAIRLRYSHQHRPRGFRIPGGNLGMWIVASIGVIGCILTIIVGFIPPAGVNVGTDMHYETLLIVGLIVMSLPPLLGYYFYNDKKALAADSAL